MYYYIVVTTLFLYLILIHSFAHCQQNVERLECSEQLKLVAHNNNHVNLTMKAKITDFPLNCVVFVWSQVCMMCVKEFTCSSYMLPLFVWLMMSESWMIKNPETTCKLKSLFLQYWWIELLEHISHIFKDYWALLVKQLYISYF